MKRRKRPEDTREYIVAVLTKSDGVEVSGWYWLRVTGKKTVGEEHGPFPEYEDAELDAERSGMMPLKEVPNP